jgi:hypothetical protein
MKLGMDIGTAHRVLDSINFSIQNHLENKDTMLLSAAADLGSVWQSPSADEFQLLMQGQVAKISPRLGEIKQLRDQLATAIREWEEVDRKFGQGKI